MDDVVKINVFLQNIADIEAVNQLYTNFFTNHLPTRTLVAVGALPLEGALVQMDALISNGEGTAPQAPCDLVKIATNSTNAPQCNAATHSVAFSHYNNISAQLPIDTKTGELVAGDITSQAKQCLNNIKAIVESIGHVMDDLVKVNIQVQNIGDVAAVNDVYRHFFQGELPARTIFAVTQIAMNALVQIDAVVSNAEGTPQAP